jgi:DNA replication protein DnaC
MYRTAGGIMTDIRGTYDGGEGSEFEILRSLRIPKLLIIDEVGATKATDFEQATLFRIINARYEANLPTIVVSNLDVTELPAVMGERSFDRLRENGGIAIKFEWASARGARHD